MEKLPTVNKKMNKMAADQLIKRLERVLRKNPSVEVLDEFAMIIRDKFPHKQGECEQILDQAIKKIQHKS